MLYLLQQMYTDLNLVEIFNIEVLLLIMTLFIKLYIVIYQIIVSTFVNITIKNSYKILQNYVLTQHPGLEENLKFPLGLD